jgi:hypothetical protein
VTGPPIHRLAVAPRKNGAVLVSVLTSRPRVDLFALCHPRVSLVGSSDPTTLCVSLLITIGTVSQLTRKSRD